MTATEQPRGQDRHSYLLQQMAQQTERVRRWTLSQALFTVGSMLVPIGLVLLGLGYWGVAHTTLVFDQLPYIASGSLFGLALVLLGGFLYFGHWQVLAVEERRVESLRQAERDRELLATLTQVRDALDAQVASSGAGSTRGLKPSRSRD
jgi:hypothetical protein